MVTSLKRDAVILKNAIVVVVVGAEDGAGEGKEERDRSWRKGGDQH